MMLRSCRLRSIPIPMQLLMVYCLFMLICLNRSAVVVRRPSPSSSSSRTINHQHDKYAFVDSSVELSCDLTNEYQDDLEWRKLTGRMSDNSIEEHGKLLLTSITEDDDGEYECFTDYGKSSKVRLTVYSKPQQKHQQQQQPLRSPIITSQQQSSHQSPSASEIITQFEREIDSDIELVCEFSRGHENEIKWRKIGGELSEYNREYGGKLLLYYLSMEDAGDYECYLPDGRSKRVRLNVIQSSSNDDYGDQQHHSVSKTATTSTTRTTSTERFDPITKTAELGSNVELSCKLTNLNAKWRKLSGGNNELSQYAREIEGKLLIYYLSENDSGDYECYLPTAADGGRQKQLVRLSVKRSSGGVSSIDYSTNSATANIYEKEAELDGNVELDCSLTATESNQNQLRWRKKGSKISRYSRQSKGKLNLYYLINDDAGIYECYLPNGETRQVRLIVKSNPTTAATTATTTTSTTSTTTSTIRQFSYDQEADENANVVLECDLTASNPESLKWRKIDGKLGDYAREHAGKLYIYYLIQADAGDYECYLPTANGQQRQVRLTVNRKDTAAFVELDRKHRVDEDQEQQQQQQHQRLETNENFDEIAEIDSNIELACQFTELHQQGLTWKKIDGNLSIYSREHEGKLSIFYLTENDQGEYECSLPDGRLSRIRLTIVKRNNNETSSSTTTTNENSIQAAYASSHEWSPSSTSKNDVEADLDSNVELSCQLSNSIDASQITWRKHKAELSEYSRSHNGKLYIYYLKPEDAGNYECSLPNGQTDRVKLTIRSSSKSLPSNQQQQQQPQQQLLFEAESGSNIELSCSLLQQSNGRADLIKWRKANGLAMSRYTRENGDGKIDIYYLTKDDAGEYECYLPNGQSEQVKLNVRGAAEEPKQQPQPQPQPKQQQQQQQQNSNSRTKYEVRAYLSKNEVELRLGNTDENVCTGLTNGDSMQIEWYNQRGERLQSDDDDVQIKTSLITQQPLTKESVIVIMKPTQRLVGQIECRVSVGGIRSSNSNQQSARFQLRLLESSESESAQLPAFIPYYKELKQQQQQKQQQRERQSMNNPPQPVVNSVLLNAFRNAQQRQQQPCGENEATCNNGECIPRSRLCDGRQDCSDGSDENYCDQCQPNEKACSNGKCIQKIWFCDGENDCEDKSDELSCPQDRSGSICKSNEFECKNRQQCILKGFVCDKEPDCADKSDEIGCEKPRAVRYPIRNLRVKRGQSFTIECQAAGFPAPFINWRLNWGHVCEEPQRCTTTNEDGFGTITVRNAQREDAGAYSCEAINSQGREFIGPDTLVVVEEEEMANEQETTTTALDDPCQQRDETTTPVGCNCHNHSECDCNGNCVSCEHNTEGANCERCREGFYGDARRGTPYDCVPYPTTSPEYNPCGYESTTEPSRCFCNHHSEICDCNGICQYCEHNTTGERCEQCLPGFEGDATRGTPYDCQAPPEPPVDHCGYQTTTEPSRCFCNHHSEICDCNGICQYCEHNTTGERCEQCLPGFHGDATRGTPYDCQQEPEPIESSHCGYETTTEPSRCFCNHHSEICDCNGICQYCEHNTTGDHCEQCLPGFEGDATRGTPYDCQAPPEPPADHCGYQTTTAEPSRCFCNHHSEICDCNGICQYCEHNTVGDQCEQCLPGFYGDATRGTPYDCQPIQQPEPEPETHCGYQTTTEPSRCFCNHHSEICDCNGICQYCEHNTSGDRCEQCLPGFHGDATRGTPYDCQPIEEPRSSCDPGTTTPPSCSCNGHSDQCSCDGICVDCQHNTAGDHCERCQDGFHGDATRGTAYDCRRIQEEHRIAEINSGSRCDPDGTQRDLGHSCRCKLGVVGEYCDQCAPKHFSFLRDRPNRVAPRRGCLSCFCNGLTVVCSSSTLRYRQLKASFEYGSSGWRLSDKYTRLSEEVDAVNNGIEFRRFSQYADSELYLIPAASVGGNRLSSYGGYIRFSIEFECDNGDGACDNDENFRNLEIRLSGNRVNIYHVHKERLEPRRKHDISIQLVEDEFKRYGDDGRVDRDHLLMALANIDLMMIRASLVKEHQTKIRLSDFSIDYAENANENNNDEAATDGAVASLVEVCDCPLGYSGLSCESCAYGYKRAKVGFYLGLCEPQNY